MTVIVGWKCKDGVVLGADSAATLGGGGLMTVRESTASKLTIVRDSLIMGLSGPMGLGQQYEAALNGITDDDFKAICAMQPAYACANISQIFWQHAEPVIGRAGVVAQATRNNSIMSDAIHSSVVAVHVQGEDRLFQFTESCAGEEARKDLPYLSIGSGQQNADPFLAFLRGTFWPDSMPALSGGIFATLWALTETIRSAPGYVGGPISIAILKNGSARMLDDDDLREHQEAIAHAQEALRAFREELEPPATV